MQGSRLTYERVYEYVRNYRNGYGEEVPYDVNGVIHFMLAALENIREQWTEIDLETIAGCATSEQRKLLIKIGRFLETYVPDEDD